MNIVQQEMTRRDDCNYSCLPSVKSYEWKALPYDRTEKRFYDSVRYSKILKDGLEKTKYLEMKKQHRAKNYIRIRLRIYIILDICHIKMT